MQPYKSEITHSKSSKPPRMFQCDAVDTSPDLEAKIVLKTVAMAIWHKKADDMNGIRESFVTGFIFTYVQNIFLWPSYGGNRSHRPPWIRHWLCFSQSKSCTCWQHLAVKSTSRLWLCGTQCQWRSHKFSTGSASVCCIHFLTTASK